MSESLPIELVSKSRANPPRLPGTVIVREEWDGIIDAMLADLFMHARNCVRTFGDFHLAVSATTQVEPFLRRLMYDPNYRDFPWGRTRVWLVDERAVPEGDERRRFPGLRDLIMEHSGIPAEQVHRLDPSGAAPAEAYTAELRQHLGWREKGHDRLDLVLLSLEAGGGVAGFDAHAAAAGDGDALVVSVSGGGESEPVRLTMSIPFINAARVVAVIATGGSSRDTVSAMARAWAQGERATAAMMLSPLAGDLRWYLDGAACPAAGNGA